LIYYTGVDPYTGKNIYVAKSVEEKRKQKDLFFWHKKDKGGEARVSRKQEKTVHPAIRGRKKGR
jgi:hypothetical protein